MGATDDLGDLTARLKLDTSDASAAVKGVAEGFPIIGAAALAVTAAVVATGAAAIDMSTKYTTATDLMASQAGITQQQAAAIGDAFLNTAGQTTFSAQQIMAAYAPVAGQLGLTEGHALNAADAMLVMSAAQNLAEATGASLKDTTSGLAAVMLAYQIPVSGAAQASDLLFNSSRALNVPVSDLAGTIDKLHAKLGPLAPSLSDVSTLLLDVESHGLTGNRALLLISTGMNTLLGGSKATDDELAKLGLTLYNAQGNFVGMGSVIAQLSPKLAKMTEEQRLAAEKALFGAGASKALDDTIMAGLPAFDAAAAAAQKHGTASQGAATATDNLGGAIERAKSAISDYLIKIGEQLQPKLALLSDWFTSTGLPAIQGFSKWIESNLIPAIEKIGKWLYDDFINPVIHIGEAVLPPVVAAVKGLVDHLDALKVPLEAIAITLGTMWAINKINDWWTAASAAVTKLLAMIDGASAASVLPAVGAAGGTAETAAAGGALLAGPAAIIAAGVTAPIAAWGVVLAQQIADNEQSFNDLNRRGDQAAQNMGLAADDLKTLTSFLQSHGQAVENSFADFTTSSAFTSLNSQQQSALMSDLVDEIRKGKVNSVNSMLDFVTNWAAMAQSSAGAVPDAKAVEQQIASVKAQLPQLIKTMIDNFAAIGTQAGRAVSDTSQIADELGVASGDLANFGAQVSGLAGGITSALGYAQTHAQQLQQAMSGVQIPSTPTPGTSPWSAFGGHQFGGIIPPGQWGIVGEAGPELAYGGAGGLNVFSRGNEPAGAGGIVINVYVQGAAPSPDDIARAIGWEMAR